ncbi:MAG: hypothetical protein GY913_10515 [Proteobacteria bacterium]|nr:hypothetical protein [Pseudomonadota bacterium]MCP4917346.1 hypothetical protein [Pseudomonadota bacterium]
MLFVLLACAPPAAIDALQTDDTAVASYTEPVDVAWSDLQAAVAITLRDCEGAFRSNLMMAEWDSREGADCPDREEERDWLRFEADGCSSALDTMYAGSIEAQNVRTSSTQRDLRRESWIDADAFAVDDRGQTVVVDGHVRWSALDGEDWAEWHHASCTTGDTELGVIGTYECTDTNPEDEACTLLPGAIAKLPGLGDISIAGNYAHTAEGVYGNVRLKGASDIEIALDGTTQGCLQVRIDGDAREVCPD